MTKGKCLRCGHEFSYDFQGLDKIINKKTCISCRKKKRLQQKANREGKSKNHYL